MIDSTLAGYLTDYFLEPGRADAVCGFWVTGEALLAKPQWMPRTVQSAAYCFRQVLSAFGATDVSSWRVLSDQVIAAKRRHAVAKGLSPEDSAAALVELLRTVNDLEVFKDTQKQQIERGLTNLLIEKTGARLLGETNPASHLQRIHKQLSDIVHSTSRADCAQVQALWDQATAIIGRVFAPPDVRLPEIDALACLPDPDQRSVPELERVIIHEHDLRYFMERAVSAGWLSVLGYHDKLTPPDEGGGWAVLALIRRLAEREGSSIGDWLADAERTWGHDPLKASHLALAARYLGPNGHRTMLRLLGRHPTVEWIRFQAMAAIENAEADSPFVTSVVGLLLKTSRP